MARASWALLVLSLSGAGLGCVQSHDLDIDFPLPQAGGSAESGFGDCEEQIESSLDGLPDELSCLGLYKDATMKQVADDVREYAPAYHLWSDGADKQRWIYLPEGEKIDASNPLDWKYPVGTKFFKQFGVGNRKVETRVYMKDSPTHWVRGAYRWNQKGTSAVRTTGEDLTNVALGGNAYHIPTGRECDQCHEGKRDRILGFEAVSLGLKGAEGITLADLVEQDLIEPKPERTELSIGDDGSGYASEAVGLLHINCGVSCHNDNTNSEGFSSKLRLQLDPADLDGRPATELDQVRENLDVNARTLRWQTEKRIAPGSADTSLIYRLSAARNAGKNNQMPPIATKIVDDHFLDVLRNWINAL